MIAHIKKWYVTHAAWISAATYFFYPAFQTWANDHPKTVFGIFCGAIVWAHNARAPKDAAKP